MAFCRKGINIILTLFIDYVSYLCIYVNMYMYILVTKSFAILEIRLSFCLEVFWAENVLGIQNHILIGKEPRRLMTKNWSTIRVEIRSRLFDGFGDLR